MSEIRFKGNGRRLIESRYNKLYNNLKKNFKDAWDNEWHSLWSWGSGRPFSRLYETIDKLNGIDTDPNFYDYNLIYSRSVGPCIVYASTSGEINKDFLDFIQTNYGNYKIHEGLSRYQILPEWNEYKNDRRLNIPTYYITINKFYDDIDFVSKYIPPVK